MSKLEAGRGAAYLYVETLTAMLSGYVFWFAISKFTTPEVLGTSAAVISLATIFTSIAGLGVPGSILRFLGKTFSDKKSADSKVYLKSSLFIMTIGVAGCSVFLLVGRDSIEHFFKINYELMLGAILVMAATAVRTQLRAVIISSLKTKALVIQSIVSTVAKFSTAIILLLLGFGAMGVTIGVATFPILGSILLGFTVAVALKGPHSKAEISFVESIRKIFSASMANWIPGLVAAVGAQLGTIVVLGSQGAGEAGFYYIAFSIVTGISTLISVLSLIAFPILSSMKDGRKRFAWRITKLSLLISVPLSHVIIFYSKEVLELFGKEYIAGSTAFELLLISTVPTAVVTGITVLVYAYGNYKQVLVMGLATSIPRTVLYFFLVPIYGGNGAAITYTTGAVVGFIASLIIARKIKMPILWRELCIISVIPAVIAFFFSFAQVNFVPGIIASLVVSYLAYLKLGILQKGDVCDALEVLPKKISEPIAAIVDSIGRRLNSHYR